MQDRSADFDKAVRLGRRGVCQVDAYFGGVATVENLPVVEGAVSLSLTGDARRSLRVTIMDANREWTSDASGPLTPWGNELRVRTGFETSAQWGQPLSPELLDQGWFRIVNTKRSLSGLTRITALDRSFVVAGAGFENPWQIPANADRAAQVAAILRQGYGGVVVDPAPPMSVVPALVVWEEGSRSGNPWRNAVDLCASDGKDLAFTVRGTAAIGYRPNPLTSPVWEYASGPGGLLLDAELDLDLTGVHNVWYVESSASSLSTTRASSEITDPASPIHPGRVGRRPTWYTDPLASTASALQAQADYYRLVEGGRPEGLTFPAKPHPAQEPGDVVSVVDDRSGLAVVGVLDSWDLDLFAQAPSTMRTLGRIVR